MHTPKLTCTAPLFGLAFLAAACAQQAPVEMAAQDLPPVAQKEVRLSPAISTVKPGASVTVTHDITQGLDAGDTGFVSLRLHEGYPGGTLQVTASGESGLAVIGGAPSISFDMTGQTTHAWRVDFETETDGVYYLNLMTTVVPDRGPASQRAHAIRVEVGDWKTAQTAAEATKPMQMQADGEMAVMMQAEETIE